MLIMPNVAPRMKLTLLDMNEAWSASDATIPADLLQRLTDFAHLRMLRHGLVSDHMAMRLTLTQAFPAGSIHGCPLCRMVLMVSEG